ncbi:hypothetical protein TSH58p_29725 (plasmid) [Azospirillum sp. TSH58]|uniref:hypothetical protein n=1 Tax=Azospirillum sp. TSH58 TaxID=664962 RepID=UPI000D5FEEF5|nr:hypothetical protein [Azospirillum sp. TSH58]AWJ87549.1 hypothetical protein TSH58p_29725 [Azospirillum sp. TSH58]PWC71605.1 hypothetical protein TSH58_10125 [Azospirillum sp. TSH58]
MNVAIATATAARPLAFMTARNSDAVETGADTGTPSAKDPVSGQSEPLSGRYTKTAYRYDADASRLVLLFRSPEDGATLDQIPTEAALRQYREAQKDRKSGKASLELLVGGSDGQDQQNGAGASGSSSNGAPLHRWVAGHSGGGAGRSTASQGPSPQASPVVASTPMTTHAAAAPSAGSASVNVVI